MTLPSSRQIQNQRGFTVLEMLCAIGIVLILAALVYGNYSGLLASAGGARCISNLRSLHTGFTGYLNDQGHWPQQPEFATESESGRLEFGKWWIHTMKPYTESTTIWICPAAVPALSARGSIPEGTLTYTPTTFDAWPNRPFQWPTMPWVVEIGGSHPGGGNVLFPDGSVRNTTDITESWK